MENVEHMDDLYNELVLSPALDSSQDPLDFGIDEHNDGSTEFEFQDLDPNTVNNDPDPVINNDPDVLKSLLLSKGIDSESIKIANEDGTEETVRFNDLSPEEQLGLIDSVSATDVTDELDDHEIDVLNFLRENEMSFEEAVDYFKRQGVEEFINEQQASNFEVDEFSDEEIYALDLKSKFDDLTDEDLEVEIEKQLENPEIFKKKVDKIREDLRQASKQDVENAEQESAVQQQQMLEELQSNLVNVATSIGDIGGLELDDNDKEEVLSLILDKDVNNSSKLLKYLDDPETLFKVSWFVLHGEEAFETIHNYWKSEIDKIGTVKKTPQQNTKGSPVYKRENFIPSPPSEAHFGKKGNVTNVDDLWK
jgi:hypothetical protein